APAPAPDPAPDSDPDPDPCFWPWPPATQLGSLLSAEREGFEPSVGFQAAPTRRCSASPARLRSSSNPTMRRRTRQPSLGVFLRHFSLINHHVSWVVMGGEDSSGTLLPSR